MKICQNAAKVGYIFTKYLKKQMAWLFAQYLAIYIIAYLSKKHKTCFTNFAKCLKNRWLDHFFNIWP